MIIQPKVRGFICTTAHPDGCARAVQDQIDWVKRQPSFRRPKESPRRRRFDRLRAGVAHCHLLWRGGSHARSLLRAASSRQTHGNGWVVQ